MVAANPTLLAVLSAPAAITAARLSRPVTCLRRCQRTFSRNCPRFGAEWSKLLIEIGAQDAASEIQFAESNRHQTELAIASINVAYLNRRRELVRRYGRTTRVTHRCVALGGWRAGGVDYRVRPRHYSSSSIR